MSTRKKTVTKRKAAPKRKPVAKKPAAKRRIVVEATEPVIEGVVAPEQKQEVQPQIDVVENAVPNEPEESASKSILDPGVSSETSSEHVESVSESASEQKPAPEPQLKDEKVSDGRSTKIYVISIIISIIILAVTSGIFVYRSQQDMNVQSEPSPTPEEVVTEEKKEEVKVVERKDISLEILNGSGVAGAAGNTSSTFEELGYEVKDVGNTAATEGNQLYISNKYSEEELANLITDVKENLDIPEVAAKLSDLDVTARIVLGR